MKSSIHPPRLAEKIFNWYCGRAKTEDLQGDMEEEFYQVAKTQSVRAARYRYWKQVVVLLFSYAIKKRKRDAAFGHLAHSGSFSPGMWRNYFKVSVRSLYRHRYFTIANAIGLSIGMSIGLLLISLYTHISTYDKFHANASRIYRVITTHQGTGRDWELACAPVSVAEKLQQDQTGIEQVVRINSYFYGEAKSGNLDIPLRGFYTEPAFLSVFSYPLIKGNAATALKHPNSIVLSESAAMKLFNTTDVLDKTFEIPAQGNFQITGIMADPPKNSHLEFEALVSYNTLAAENQHYQGNYRDWSEFGRQYVYLLVQDNAQLSAISHHLDEQSSEASQLADAQIHFTLQALTDITPGKDLSTLVGGLGTKWDSLTLSVFGVICLFILLPACFNYANISIARALKRAKEIGLRKTLGSEKKQIFFQFITETVIITTISLGGAILLFMVAREEFKGMVVGGSGLDLGLTLPMMGAFLLFAIMTGLVAGIFPALHFARLNPIQALKSQSSAHGTSNGRIRKLLTIFQFALSFGFILSLVVFSHQYRYSVNFDFGFNKDNILNIQLQDADQERFRNQFSSLSSVQRISMASGVLGLNYTETNAKTPGSTDSVEVDQLFVDANYLPNMKLQLLAGSNFPHEMTGQEKYIIVNEEFLKQNGIPDAASAIGKIYEVDEHDLEIIGVVKNFHFASLRKPIQSFFFRMDPKQFTVANLNVNFDNSFEGISQMENMWKTMSAKKMEAKFFDAEIRDAYDFYKTLLKIVGYLGMLAVSITLLGLLGMVVYTTESRTKEVSIRKIMGASTLGITALLSKDYLKMMLWATGFAIPVTTLLFSFVLPLMQHYHAAVSVGDVVLSFFILLLLGLITLASQTYKTASSNPADTLKYE